MTNYYHYDSVTGEYLGLTPARLDPMETAIAGDDVYMRPPSSACTDVPPVANINQVAVRRADAWVVVADHRGEVYWLADGSEHTITGLDVEPPADALPALPAAIKLASDKDAKRAAIRAAYSVAVIAPQQINGVTYHGGFDSVIRLDGAKRLAVDLGMNEVTLFDIDDVGHALAIADATQVIQVLGQKTQADFAKKQGLMVDIKNADLAGLAAISW